MKRGFPLFVLPALFVGCSFDNSTPPLHSQLSIERTEVGNGIVGLRGNVISTNAANSRDWETSSLQGAGDVGMGIGGSSGPAGGVGFGSGSSAGVSSGSAFSGSGNTTSLGTGIGNN